MRVIDLLHLSLLLLLGLAIALTALTVATLVILCRPRRWTYTTAVARGEPGDPSELDEPLPFRQWTLRDPVSKGELPVWEIEGGDAAGPALILTPGWSESRVAGLGRVAALAPVCSRLYAWDPPGLGEAPGRSTLGAREPLALAALLERVAQAQPEAPLALFGWSMGAGIAIAAATFEAWRERVGCVIAEAPYRRPFTPARNVARLWKLPATPNTQLAVALLGLGTGAGLTWSRCDRAAQARWLRAPLLVLHGDADVVCPIEEGQAIAQAAPRGMLVVVAGAGHSDMWTEPAFASQAAQAVRSFLAAAQLPTTGAVD